MGTKFLNGAIGGFANDAPSRLGVAEYNFHPISATVANTFTSGRIYGSSFIAQSNATISKVGTSVTFLASTPTSGQNLMGLYSVSGTTATQILTTADLGTWTALGWNAYSFTSSATMVQGNWYIWLAMSNASSPVRLVGWQTGTTPFPAMFSANTSNTAAPFLPFFVQTSTGATALPSSFTISSSTMSLTNAICPAFTLL